LESCSTPVDVVLPPPCSASRVNQDWDILWCTVFCCGNYTVRYANVCTVCWWGWESHDLFVCKTLIATPSNDQCDVCGNFTAQRAMRFIYLRTVVSRPKYVRACEKVTLCSLSEGWVFRVVQYDGFIESNEFIKKREQINVTTTRLPSLYSSMDEELLIFQ
jgi:hypothetical protein